MRADYRIDLLPLLGIRPAKEARLHRHFLNTRADTSRRLGVVACAGVDATTERPVLGGRHDEPRPVPCRAEQRGVTSIVQS
jgi:hypothetical protein